jgi:hypothetical protein
LLDALDELREAARQRIVVLEQRGFGGFGGVDERGRMRKARLHGVEIAPFLFRDGERCELALALGQEIALGRGGRGSAGGGIALVDGRAPGAPRLRDLARQRREPAERIDQRALRLARGQRLMRVLPMHADETLAQLGELRERGGAAVDPRAAAPVRLEHPAHQQRVVGGEGLLAEPGGDTRRIVDVELGRELGAFGARAQLPQLEAVAQKQAQRVEEDGLARAGFAGEHREAARELEVERLHDDEVANRQQAQHQSVFLP